MNLDAFTYFYPERPRLLHPEQELFDRLSDDPRWVGELKFNGKRLELHHLPSGIFEFWNRHGQKMSYSPSPELAQALDALNLKGYWLFDGELRDGKVKGVRHRVVLYDVFVADGHLLIGKDYPFEERRGYLETLFHYRGPDTGETLDLAGQYDGDFRDVFQRHLPDPEIEGLVLKNLGGVLQLGRSRAVDSAWMWKVRKGNNSYAF